MGVINDVENMRKNGVFRNGFRVLSAGTPAVPTIPLNDLALEEASTPLFGDDSLASFCRPGLRVTIAFTDATRPTPDRTLIALLLAELERNGVRRHDVTLLCAVGLHRPMTESELRNRLGEENLRDVAVVNHDAFDRESIVNLGEIDSLPITINRRCVETDLLIATGIVEPHQYAGFSGGAKTVAIGCAGETTISATHGPEMLDHPGTMLGRVEGNPFQEFVRKAGERIGLRYVVNVVLDTDGSVVAAGCGNPDVMHDVLTERCEEAFSVRVAEPVHAAIAGVPASKGSNLYQASRAATYLALSDRTPLLPGAPIILPATIPEGAGRGTGEQRFFEIMSSGTSPKEVVDRLRREGFPGGAQRAYVLAKALVHHPIIVAGAEDRDVVSDCGMIPATDLDEALTLARGIVADTFTLSEGSAPLLLDVPDALRTMVRLRS